MILKLLFAINMTVQMPSLSHPYTVFSFPVFKLTTASTRTVNKRAQDDSTQSPINAVVYISFGVAFILLLFLSAAIGFWCYRKSRHKQMKRFVTPMSGWGLVIPPPPLF